MRSSGAAEFTNKLTGLMEGMVLLGYIRPAGCIQTAIKNLLEYKRISLTADGQDNHAKMVMVDGSVCYIGSDNAYPSYNQEFGLLVDDGPSVQSLVPGYWAGLREFAQPDAQPAPVTEVNR